jgi:HAD superfamily hydrolase (TIGR01549 family)
MNNNKDPDCTTASSKVGGASAIDPFDPDSFKEPAIMSGTTAPAQEKPEVELLVFDMGHVFVDFTWSEVCKGFCDRAGMTSEQFKEVLAFVGTLGYEDGRVMTEGFVKALNEKLSLSMTTTEFDQLWNFGFHENVEMAALLGELGKRYPLYLLSNTNESHYGFLSSKFKVDRHFKELILSHKVGFTKPDPRIYQEVLNRSGIAANKCVFVDDLERNVQAAAALGMNTVRFVGIEDLKEKLRGLGVTV